MAALVSFVSVAAMLQAFMHVRCQRAVFVGIAVLVTAIASDSPVADESPLDSTQQPMQFPGNTPSPTGSSPSALPHSHSTALANPITPGFLQSSPQPIHEGQTTDTMSFQSTSKSILTTPSLSFSKPIPGFDQHSTERSTHPRNQTDSNQQLPSKSPTLTSQPHSQLNLSIAPLSPFAFTQSTPQLGVTSAQKAITHKNERTLAIVTLTPDEPSVPPSFPDFLADEALGKVADQSSPSSAPLEENKPADDLNVHLNPNEIISLGHNVPFMALHHTSPSPSPTEVSPEDFYPTNTMDFDWGSGDYLETMSFFDSDRDDYSIATKVPTDPYDLDDYTETYDTSFPSRVGISPSSVHPHSVSSSPSHIILYNTINPSKSIYATTPSTTVQFDLEPTPMANSEEVSDIDWADTFTIQPTDVLLPDMNSMEYYTTQLSKDNSSLETGAEHRGNLTVVSIGTTDVMPTDSTTDRQLIEEESSGDLSGFEPHVESTTVLTTEMSPHPVNVSEPFLDPSIVPTHSLDPSWSGHSFAESTEIVQPSATPLLPPDSISSSFLTDVHWFVTETFPKTTILTTTVLTPTVAFSSVITEPAANFTPTSTPLSSQDSTFTTEQTLNSTLTSTESSSHNVTIVPPFVMGDQGVTEDEVDIPVTLTPIPGSSDVNTLTSTTATTTTHQVTTRFTATTKASTNVNIISTTRGTTAATTPTARQYLCNLDRPNYLIKIGFPFGVTVGHAKSQIRDVLKREFNQSVELQVLDPPPRFVFRVVSGPVVYTAISVINALRRSERRFLSLSPTWTTPDHKYQVHTVLQFVPGHVDVRFCNFSESIEKGLTLALAEVRRRSKESTNFTVHIVNITMTPPKNEEQKILRKPVDITFTVRGSRGYLTGSEVSNALIKLTMVEFSYYMGFPVLQIAEPFHYPELNTSQLLRSSWVRTVLLGVMDQKAGERTFQANMERRVAALLGEAMGSTRRVRRATTIGNSSVQVVSADRLDGTDHPLEIVYFVEGPHGQRIPADQTAELLNGLDVQRAAIVLGYRVQGVLAQPVEKVASLPSDSEKTNLWIVVGVVIPLLVVIVIISILYWKLCRTDKLEFQPDAMTSIQQRQKLQAPSVKGFDFAKLHLGQQSKDDIMVIQESAAAPGNGPGPLALSLKDGLSPSENGEIPTPASKASAASTRASRSGRRRERISPSDGDSVVSDHSSERDSTEENLRVHAPPSDSKQTRKVPINVLNGPPPMNGTGEQLSSAAIFEHVDRMSRATDASRRLPNKVQLIAMQPMAVPPLHNPAANGKLADANQINKEIQVALRHKSEIEHHRNKIRLRAKRKGHYDFPAMDDVIGGLGDAKDQDHIYQKAQTQIDKILGPDAQMPSVYIEPKRSSGRGRRSPKQRLKELNGGMMEADKDHLITEDNDAAYRKCPGVNNVAYVSDPDQGQGSPHRSPSPTDDVFLGCASSPPGHAPPPPPYMPPQPSIEEARQQMHSLLDDAFALVSPTSQGSTAGITLPGVNNNNQTGSSPPGRGPRPWGPSYQPLSPYPRFTDLSLSPPPVQGLTPRQGLGSSYLPTSDTAGHGEQLQPDSLFSSRALYADELPSSARPRPVGGKTGAQLHHLTQVGLSSRINGFPAGVRATPGQNGGWNHYHDDNFSRTEPEKDAMHRGGIREPSVAHLDTSGVGYLTAPPPLNTSPPTHSSASLIKAIREELLRLSQKQAAVSGYHS